MHYIILSSKGIPTKDNGQAQEATELSMYLLIESLPK